MIIHIFHPRSPLQLTSLHFTVLHYNSLSIFNLTPGRSGTTQLYTAQRVSIPLTYLIHSWGFPVPSKPQIAGATINLTLLCKGIFYRDGTTGHVTSSKHMPDTSPYSTISEFTDKNKFEIASPTSPSARDKARSSVYPSTVYRFRIYL